MLPALLLASNLAQADLGACPASPAEIRVTEQIAPPRTDLSKSERELREMKFDGSIAGDRRFTELTGLTVASIAVDSEIRIASTTSESGQICAWPSVVTITLSTAPVVYALSGRGECRLSVALSHEMRHVAVDKAIIDRYAGTFRRRVTAMTDAIDEAGAPPRATLQILRRRIEEKIDAMIAVTADAMNSDRAAEQRALDSAEEYQRLSDACHQIEAQPESKLVPRT